MLTDRVYFISTDVVYTDHRYGRQTRGKGVLSFICSTQTTEPVTENGSNLAKRRVAAVQWSPYPHSADTCPSYIKVDCGSSPQLGTLNSDIKDIHGSPGAIQLVSTSGFTGST